MTSPLERLRAAVVHVAQTAHAVHDRATMIHPDDDIRSVRGTPRAWRVDGADWAELRTALEAWTAASRLMNAPALRRRGPTRRKA